MSRETKGAAAGLTAGLVALGAVFGLSSILHRAAPAPPPGPAQARQGMASMDAMPMDAAHLARGKALFAQNCASCHGAGAEGGFGPDLRGLDPKKVSTIKNGVPGKMPAFGGKLAEGDIQSIVQYARSLKP